MFRLQAELLSLGENMTMRCRLPPPKPGFKVYPSRDLAATAARVPDAPHVLYLRY